LGGLAFLDTPLLNFKTVNLSWITKSAGY